MIRHNDALIYHYLLYQEMNRLKKSLRLLGLIFLIILASIGMGISTSLNRREEYMDYEVKIEQSEMKDEESESELNEKKG